MVVAKVLVIGNGGREHAICWKLAKSDFVAKIFAMPGNSGIQKLEKCETVNNMDNFEMVGEWCKNQGIDLVVVGPEDPLARGISDVLKIFGIRCFGPSKLGAQIESDKKWAKEFMCRQNIPTARFECFDDPEEAKKFILNAPFNALVVKAAGLAAGKGVIVSDTKNEACEAVDLILEEKKFGDAGQIIVVEELLHGEEISVLAFVDSTCVEIMLPAQDHKRLHENDQGPNTGGMGAYCPCPLISSSDLEYVKLNVLQKCLTGLQNENIDYRGILYAGIMLTADGPKVLEFNCRFGDPEAQVILPLLKSDLYEVIIACCNNNLNQIKLNWNTDLNAVGVVMASAGYPAKQTLGSKIEGILCNSDNKIIFHSGVSIDMNGDYVTNGGRVLVAVAVSDNLDDAAAQATEMCKNIKFHGAQFRSDIAKKAFQCSRYNSRQFSLSYKDCGVDIDAGNKFVQNIKHLSQNTKRPGVIGNLGNFGGLYSLKEFKKPIICEAVNGVGSKIVLSFEHKMYEEIGVDLLAICANDLLESGAEPIAFLDYIACGKLDVLIAEKIIRGIATGCGEAKCALLGGETAEIPSFYESGKYDLVGYCVGVVERGFKLPKFEEYEDGDLIVALPSSGLHCTGFNIFLQHLLELKIDLKEKIELYGSLEVIGRVLSKPSKIYVSDVLKLIRNKCVKSLAHIKEGLLLDIQRITSKDFQIQLNFEHIEIPEEIFWISEKCNISTDSLLHNTNCGIGMVLVISKDDTKWKSQLREGKIFGTIRKTSSLNQVEIKNFEKVFSKAGAPFKKHVNCSNESKYFSIPLSVQNYNRCTHLKEETQNSVLVLGTDGVGSKLKIAQLTNLYNTVGIDLVAMSVNDILSNGAEPLTFSSYYVNEKRSRETDLSIAEGIEEGARQANTKITESITTENPFLYKNGLFDLAGFSLGITENHRILPKVDDIKAGDIIIGLPSSGVHSNGFSLVHLVLKLIGANWYDKLPFSNLTLSEEFLKPTKIYVKALLPLVQQMFIKAMAHITGGGIMENIPRVLNKHLCAHINADNFVIPPIFGWIAEHGNVCYSEMLRTFNCGIGMVVVVDPQHEEKVLQHLQFSERARKIGVIIQRQTPNSTQVLVENFEKHLSFAKKNIHLKMKRVAVLISGKGTNLQALIHACRDSSQGLFCDIVLVICNKPNAMGLNIAQNAGIKHIIVAENVKNRTEYDMLLNKHLVENSVEIVCLAGFMRILSKDFVKSWKGKLINIHPSLLPRHPGLNAQKKALKSKDTESGCTVHFVDEGVDTGAIILQTKVRIFPEDTEESLTQRILQAEHYTYPQALRLLATNMIVLNDKDEIDSLIL